MKRKKYKGEIAFKILHCWSEYCLGRKTKHDPNRQGIKGMLFACRECGRERTAE